jgi:hypothetical protein
MTELKGLIERLVEALDGAGIPFMIAGSFASAAHGLPRTTQDVDVVIDPPTPDALDALVQSMSPDDVPVYVASPEDTIVAKLEWSQQSGGSERQRRDVAGILATMGDQLDREYIARWALELDLADEWDQAQKISV